METILYTDSAKVKICADGPSVIIGEKINPTGRKKLAAALEARNLEVVVELATRQVAWGADVLDVNVGVPGIDEVTLLPEVVKRVSSAVKVPLCIDTPNHAALAAALPVTPGKPLVNSVNGEAKSLQTVLPLVKDRGAAVIGLVMDENGIPATAEERLGLAGRIIERATQIGIPIEDIVIDPLVLTVGAASNAGAVTLKTIQLVHEEFGSLGVAVVNRCSSPYMGIAERITAICGDRIAPASLESRQFPMSQEFGVNINLGASNVSFGLPDRHTLNQAFLALAIGNGASCMITDPMKLTTIIRATDLMLGRDSYARRWITYFRRHPPESK